MAKTKRKHLADLDAEMKQRPLAQHSVKSDPMVEASQPLPPFRKQGNTLKPEPLALPSSTLPSNEQQRHSIKHDTEGGPVADLSHTSSSSQKAGPEVEQAMKPAAVAHSGDDSDSNSWVEVRKQRIVIIIPPLPKGKPKLLKSHQRIGNLHKDNHQCTQWKNRVKGKVSNTNVYGKKTWKSATRALETEKTGEGSIAKRVRGNVRADVPPISSMDILLASALDTDHAICTPWQGKCTQEVSLETADSSAQPKNSLFKEIKGLKVPAVRSKKTGHTRISLCTSAHPNIARKRKVSHQAANDARGDKKRPGTVDMKEKRHKYNGSDPPVLTSSQAIKVVTLKKHLEKAGGLRSWLCSVGLGQFEEAFEKRMLSERDLLQLQMDDLKKMGEWAVGPRRKLIWAINRLSQQYI